MSKSIDQTMIKHIDKTSKSYFTDKLCGYLMGLPIFFELSSSGIKLPTSHFFMEGIPLHTSMLALLLLIPSYSIKREHLIFVLVFLSYITMSAFQDFSRSILAIQSMYFFAFFYLLSSISNERVKTIASSTCIAFFVFIIAHLISIIVNLDGSILNLFLNSSSFWGQIIYQSHLTYPLVMIFVLMMVESLPLKKSFKYKYILLGSVILLEIILLRRTSFALLLGFLFLYRPKIFYSGILLFLIIFVLYLGIIPDLGDRLNFTRANAWIDSVNIITKDLFYLLMGNGLNNYSHNYFMHTVSTHGIIYGLVIFSILFSIIFNFLKRINFSISPSLMIGLFIFIDWNVNANLYQPYYAGIFALTLILLSINSKKKVID